MAIEDVSSNVKDFLDEFVSISEAKDVTDEIIFNVLQMQDDEELKVMKTSDIYFVSALFNRKVKLKLVMNAKYTEGILKFDIFVPNEYRRQGYGTKCMKLLTSLADKHDIMLCGVIADPCDVEKDCLSKSQLEKWYIKLGFASFPHEQAIAIFYNINLPLK